MLSRMMVERGLKCALSVRVDFEFASMKYLFSLSHQDNNCAKLGQLLKDHPGAVEMAVPCCDLPAAGARSPLLLAAAAASSSCWFWLIMLALEPCSSCSSS